MTMRCPIAKFVCPARWATVVAHLIGVAAVLPCSASAADISTTELLRLVRNAVRSRAERYNPCRFEYRIEEFDSVASLRKSASTSMLFQPPGAPKLPEPEFADVHFHMDVDLARKGALVRTSRSGPTVFNGQLIDNPQPFIDVYDGHKTICFNNQRTPSVNGQPARDTYLVSSNVADVGPAYGDPWLEGGDALLGVMLYAYEGKSAEEYAKDVTVQEETGAEGEAILRITRTYPRTFPGDEDEAWLLRDHDFLVSRIERRSHGVSQDASRTTSFGELHGVWFPKEVLHSYFSKDGSLLQERKITVLRATDDPKEIPDTLFTLEIPANAAIYDKDLDRLLMHPKDVEDYLRSMAGGWAGSGLTWVMIGNGIVLLSLLVWWGRSIARRRRATGA